MWSVSFGVVSCPECRRFQAVRANSKRTACRSCGHGFDPHVRGFLWRTDDGQEAARAVQAMSLRAAGEEAAQVQQLLAPAPPPPNHVEVLLERWRSSGRMWSRKEFLATVGAMGAFDDPEDVWEALEAAGKVYEPKPGHYRPL